MKQITESATTYYSAPEHKKDHVYWYQCALHTVILKLYYECNKFANDTICGCVRYIGVFITFIMFPIYIITRIFKIIFPLYIIIYLLIYNEFNKIPAFQLSMLFIYLGLVFIIYVLLYPVIIIYHSMWHIFPGMPKNEIYIQNERNGYIMINNINKYYNDILLIPIKKQILIEYFGNDIGCIIDSYNNTLQNWKKLKTIRF